MAELGISNPRPPGWITEADALSTILTTAGFTDVRVDESPHMFRYASRDQ